MAGRAIVTVENSSRHSRLFVDRSRSLESDEQEGGMLERIADRLHEGGSDMSVDLSGLPNLLAYKARVAARPKVVEALTKEGLMKAA